jgi:hypothetical protein
VSDVRATTEVAGRYRRGLRTPEAIRARRSEVARLAALGRSDKEIAAEIGVSWRTVLRDRVADGIPSTWKPEPVVQPHGTDARYSAGCRCTECRAAHAVRHRANNHAVGRTLRYYRKCPDCGTRCVTDTADSPVDCICQVQPELRALVPDSTSPDVCAMDDCDEPPFCRGLCRSHYHRQRYRRARAQAAAAHTAGTTR